MKKILLNGLHFFIYVALVITIFYGVSQAAAVSQAKSLYVIDDINAYPNIPISAYGIQGNSVVKQATNYVTDYGGGAVGLAIW